MDTVLVVATLSTWSIDSVEAALRREGIFDIAVTSVRGYGASVDYLSRDHLVDRVKLEVLVARDDAVRVANAIARASEAGAPGEGTIAILPTNFVLDMRTSASRQAPAER